MFRRLIAGALFAGLSAGALAALLQLVFVVPLIQEGELYETGARVHFGAPVADHDHAGNGADDHDHAEDAAAATADDAAGVAFDAARALGTVAMFLVTYTGFALMMVAGFAAAERTGHNVTARRGLIWGLAGFLAVQLAPAFGLPPELPGSGGAALQDRQLWWVLCVLASGAGIALIGLGRGVAAVTGGVVLIALPHVFGAPEAAPAGVVPPELAAHFTARALGVGAVAWAVLGTVAGALWARDATA